ncbi:MAG: hypothetical protein M0P74_07775, partial [Syntrophales bacterium]|nr:hypothetical protein [Syntrophales bacterium]
MRNSKLTKKLLATETERFLTSLADDFRVNLPDIRELIGHFHREMERGLAGEQSSLKMIPAFVSRPTGAEKGDFLALDLGGTNLRVLAVGLNGNRSASLGATERFVIPQALMEGEGKALFDFIADCVKTFFQKHETSTRHLHDLAFTFSFPVVQLSIVSGELIGWTKGFTDAGVEGRDVVRLLCEALERKGLGFIHIAALTND